MLNTIRLPARQRDNYSGHRRRVVGRAFHTRRPTAAARARLLSQPSAHRKFFLATTRSIPALESISELAPPSSNRPTKRKISRRRVCARDAYRPHRAGNVATPLAEGSGISLCFGQPIEGDAL